MYALRNKSSVYHLFDPKTGLTVCGQPASRIRRSFTSGEASLHVTPTQPLNKSVCKHCIRAAEPLS
jgi:hypothetical protein